MDSEVVHALLGLLNQRIAEDLPCQIFGNTVHLLQCLIDRHGTDRHGRITDNPLTRLVDILAG